MFETKRLILRKPRKSDWKDIVEGCKELEVTKYLAAVPHPYKKKDAEWFINDCLKKWRKKEQTEYHFFIELKKEKKVIGVTGISNVQKFNGTAETGSWINKKYWRKGYITETKIPILDLAFNKLKLNKVETGAFANNKASNIMSQKLGFKHEGIKRKHLKSRATNKMHDENMYGILKSEWKKARPIILRRLK
jgi:[ribosomal protein S5]-alanine N-acetyltransferase